MAVGKDVGRLEMQHSSYRKTNEEPLTCFIMEL